MSSQKNRVLKLYRDLVKLSKTWNSVKPEQTAEERAFIRNEARSRFNDNRSVTDPAKIDELIKEGEYRIGQAYHYRIPYDKPSYLPPQTTFDVHVKNRSYKFRMPKKPIA
uniref:Complex1_LYR_dom domain-containing protein n=1 Tax=Steinernema glaseri TaxID=37863 RepID=A0A1I7ZQ44_9BILA